jgi:glucose-6-phosphate 1-dehydrogenase
MASDKKKSQSEENPLRDGPRVGKPPEPVSVVIFGASGDLTDRKLLPALFSLASESRLPLSFNIVGFARRPWSHDEFRAKMKEGVKSFSRYKPDSGSAWDSFAENVFYIPGDFDVPENFVKLDTFLQDKATERQMPDNRVYYFAAPPQSYDEIIRNLDHAKMSHDSSAGWRRIVIEKPFGNDLASAIALNKVVHHAFDEPQVYRIDHYLGKETVQNILVMRFANAIFEPIWNRSYVDQVQISVAESVGVGSRAGYYDTAGVVRDIFQNHILQLLTLIGMEPPVALEADAIRDEKVKVLRAMRIPTPDDVRANTIRAQYMGGTVDGERVSSYMEEVGVADDSKTATYAAMKWHIDNWRWQDVPFYVRSGKRMPTRATEISIHFKRPPHLLFDAADDEAMRSNVLALRIQPDEGISLQTEAKTPGQGMHRRPVTLDFRYGTSFGITEPPDAYERLLLDAMLGEATLFTRSDEIERAWSLIDPVLAVWHDDPDVPVHAYEAGTWGPDAADELLERDGHRWRRI